MPRFRPVRRDTVLQPMDLLEQQVIVHAPFTDPFFSTTSTRFLTSFLRPILPPRRECPRVRPASRPVVPAPGPGCSADFFRRPLFEQPHHHLSYDQGLQFASGGLITADCASPVLSLRRGPAIPRELGLTMICESFDRRRAPRAIRVVELAGRLSIGHATDITRMQKNTTSRCLASNQRYTLGVGQPVQPGSEGATSL